MERHRSLWLYLDRHPEMFQPGMQILHVAPENVLRNRFRKIEGVDYLGGDLTAEFGPEQVDVTDLALGDETTDLVVCNHVLEHVPDDRKAIAEIFRVLRPGGWAILLVPDVERSGDQPTEEDPDISDPEEMLNRFGQRDHVRRYGWDYVDRLCEAGFVVNTVRPDHEFSDSDIRQYRLEKQGLLEPIFLAVKPDW